MSTDPRVPKNNELIDQVSHQKSIKKCHGG